MMYFVPRTPARRLPGFHVGVRSIALTLAGMILALGVAAQDAPQPPSRAAPPAPGDESMRFGRVYRISGEITVSRAGDQSDRPLQDGEVTYVGDVIRAGPNAEGIIKTDDAGMIGIRPNTEFVAEHFAAKAQPTDTMDLRLVRGSLRIISGWIGRLNQQNYAIRTPAATIGVRGTDHEPYVLSADAAAGTPYNAGSYDKVNTGRTVITTPGGEIEVTAGHVGFARGTGNGQKTRGLLTLLLPVLLDRIPDFYTGGQFEAELDTYSRGADATSRERYREQRAAPGPTASGECSPRLVARQWITRFDRAVAEKNVAAVVALFAADAHIEAHVHDRGGQFSSVSFTREELAVSATQAVSTLQNYSQRRTTLDAVAVPDAQATGCTPVSVKSMVIEQGRQSNRPYRFEATEEYVLEERDGTWVATRAVTTQK